MRLRAWSTRERVLPMTAETARMALEALMRIIGETNGVEIETILKETKDHECVQN